MKSAGAVKLGIVDSTPVTFLRVELTPLEKRLAQEMGEGSAFGAADVECLAIAKSRNCLILSNDRQVRNEADSLSLEHLSLPLLLRELWKTGVLSKAGVERLVDEIERKDRIVIRNKGLIFQ